MGEGGKDRACWQHRADIHEQPSSFVPEKRGLRIGEGRDRWLERGEALRQGSCILASEAAAHLSGRYV